MSKKLLYLTGIGLVILAGILLYGFLCCKGKLGHRSGETPEAALTAPGTRLPFSLAGKDFTFGTTGNFGFLKDRFGILLPVDDSIRMGVERLKEYLGGDAGRKLLITGYCTPEENNGSIYPNLGHARANQVKNFFVQCGIPSSRLTVKGEVQEGWLIRGDTVAGAVGFTIREPEAGAEAAGATDWQAVKDQLNANPLILYFDVNQTELNLTAGERERIAALVEYLDQAEGSALQVTGHTDNTGSREQNVQLGLKRAEFIRSHLEANGIDGSRITTTSRGPDEPVADNATEVGKKLNRRTVIIIQ